jgi:hypothetical protein
MQKPIEGLSRDSADTNYTLNKGVIDFSESITDQFSAIYNCFSLEIVVEVKLR